MGRPDIGGVELDVAAGGDPPGGVGDVDAEQAGLIRELGAWALASTSGGAPLGTTNRA